MPTTAGIAPIEVDDSLESLLATHPTTTQRVYLVTLAIVAGAIGMVLTTSVDVTVRAPAVLRPLSERQTLRTRTDGVVERVPATRGQRVLAGDTVVYLAAGSSARVRQTLERALADQIAARHDLALLSSAPDSAPRLAARLTLPRLRASADEARVEQRQLALEEVRAVRARDRVRLLAARGFAAPSEVEASELDAAHAAEARALALERRRAGWETALSEAGQRIEELRRDIARAEGERGALAVIAPVAGTLDELAPLTPGSALRTGDVVATISPDDALVVEALVPPKDVARVRPGMMVRLLVDGYDAQVWGTATGTVTRVASDFTLAGEEPVFRVEIRPLTDSLRRPDGRTVPLKKGMRAQARFLAGRRRLTELLVHRAGEWLDPSSPGPRRVR